CIKPVRLNDGVEDNLSQIYICNDAQLPILRSGTLVRHGIDFKTHSQCQRRGGNPPLAKPRTYPWLGSGFLHWSGPSRSCAFALRGNEPGGASRDRTDDLKLAKLALSQLSYGPVRRCGTRRCARAYVTMVG